MLHYHEKESIAYARDSRRLIGSLGLCGSLDEKPIEATLYDMAYLCFNLDLA